MTRTYGLFEIRLEEIDPPTHNPRFAAEGLDDLAASIAGVGILEPLICKANGDRVRLVAGLRRFTAARQVGLKTAPCIVFPSMTEAQELGISLVENLHRREMSPVEKGEAFFRLQETGLNQKAVGRMVGCSDYVVSVCIRIARQLIPEAREACHRGALTQGDAYTLARLPHDMQRKVYLREAPKPRQKGGNRTSWAEVSLRSALAAMKDGDRVLALAHAEKACEYLRSGKRLQAVN